MLSNWSLFLVLSLPLPTLEAGGQPPVQAGDDQVRYLSSIHIPQGAVAGEAVCILCSIRVDGKLTGEAVAVWGDIVVSGTVADEVVTAGGNVRLLAGSRVGNEVVAVGGNVDRDPQASVAGSIEEVAYLFFPGQRSFPWPGATLFALATLATLVLASGLLWKRRAVLLKSTLLHRPVAALLVGVAGWVVILFATDMTSFLGRWEDLGDLVLVALLLLPAWIGSAGLVRFLGDLLFPAHAGRAVAAGSVILLLLLMVPVMGLLTLLLLLLLGWGTAVTSGLGSDPDWLLRRFRGKAAPV